MRPKHPLDNADCALLVEPCGDGFWQCRFEGNSKEEAVGKFASKVTAETFARANFTNIRVVEPAPAQLQSTPVLARSLTKTLAHLNIIQTTT